jgi:hypothetical protein
MYGVTMDLLKKLFNKKKEYKPINDLEELCQLSAINIDYKPKFYQLLTSNKVFVIGKVGEKEKKEFLVNLIKAKPQVYAYTSKQSFKHNKDSLQNVLAFIEMKTLKVFKILGDANVTLVLLGGDVGETF